MCNAACIDEAINRVHTEMCAFSEFIVFPRRFYRAQVVHSCFERLFACTLGFPKLAFLRDLQNFLCHTLGFPSTLESISHSPGLLGYSKNFVPQIRLVARRDNMLLLSLLVNQARSFPEICSTFQIAFLRKEKGWLLEKWLQEKYGVVHDVKKCNKLCHSSRVKLPFVGMSASWFLDSTYFI